MIVETQKKNKVMSEYVEYKGLWFNETSISPEVKEIIVNNVGTERRFRFWFGDETGKSWNDTYDVTGYIGKSCGSVKVPLLLHNLRSIGGGELMYNRIIKIVETSTKKVLYQHSKFNQSMFVVRDSDCTVHSDLELFAQGFKTIKSAQRYADFMNGKRMSP